MEKMFIAGGKAFSLDDVEWADKTGVCDMRFCQNDWEHCEFASGKRNGKFYCETTLLAHCCKHVIKGSNEEQEKFRQIAKSEFGKKGVLPQKISEDKWVVDIYEDISKEVLKTTTHIGISAANKDKINYFCTGNGVYQGFTDYIELNPSEERMLKSTIVSMYLKDIDINTYWFLICLYERDWLFHNEGISGAELAPVMRKDANDIEISVDEAIARGREFFIWNNKRSDIQYGSLMYFYSSPREKIGSFYKGIYEETGLCSCNFYDAINKKENTQKIKEFMIRENRTYRNKVIRFFLNEICPLDWSLRTKEEKELAMLNYKTYLENAARDKTDDITTEEMELFFLNIYLAEEKNNCINHIAKGWDKIIETIQSVEHNVNSRFNIVDFTVFYIISSYTYFFIALYVKWFLHYKTQIEITQDFIDDIRDWKKGYDKILDIAKAPSEDALFWKKKFAEWQLKFDQLYRLEEPRADLIELLY